MGRDLRSELHVAALSSKSNNHIRATSLADYGRSTGNDDGDGVSSVYSNGSDGYIGGVASDKGISVISGYGVDGGGRRNGGGDNCCYCCCC